MIISWRVLLPLLLLLHHFNAKEVTVEDIPGYVPNYSCSNRSVGSTEIPDGFEAKKGIDGNVWYLNGKGGGRLNLARSAGRFSVSNADRVFGLMIPTDISINVTDLTINDLLTRKDFISFELIPSFLYFSWETVFWSIADGSAYESYLAIDLLGNSEPVIKNFQYLNDSQLRGKNTTNSNCNPPMVERFIIPDNYSVPVEAPPGAADYCSFLQQGGKGVPEFVPDISGSSSTSPPGTTFINLANPVWMNQLQKLSIPKGSTVYVIDSPGFFVAREVVVSGSMFMGAVPCRLQSNIKVIGLQIMNATGDGVVSIYGSPTSRQWVRPLYELSPGDTMIYFDPFTYPSGWGDSDKLYIGASFRTTDQSMLPETRPLAKKFHNNALQLSRPVSYHHDTDEENTYLIANLERSIIVAESSFEVGPTTDIALITKEGVYEDRYSEVVRQDLLQPKQIGIRFPSIPIPKGAVIDEAIFAFKAVNTAPSYAASMSFGAIENPLSPPWSVDVFVNEPLMIYGTVIESSSWWSGNLYQCTEFHRIVQKWVSDPRYDPLNNSFAFIGFTRVAIPDNIKWIPQWDPAIAISYHISGNGSFNGEHNAHVSLGGISFAGHYGNDRDTPFQKYYDNTTVTISDSLFLETAGSAIMTGNGSLTVVQSALLDTRECDGWVASGDVDVKYIYNAVDSLLFYNPKYKNVAFGATYAKGDVIVIGNTVTFANIGIGVSGPGDGSLTFHGNELYVTSLVTSRPPWSRAWTDGGMPVIRHTILFLAKVYVESDVLLQNIYLAIHSSIDLALQTQFSAVIIHDQGYQVPQEATKGWQYRVAYPDGVLLYRNFTFGGENNLQRVYNAYPVAPGLTIMDNHDVDVVYNLELFKTMDYFLQESTTTGEPPAILSTSSWWNPCNICTISAEHQRCEIEHHDDFPYNFGQLKLHFPGTAHGANFYMSRVGGISGVPSNPVIDSSPVYPEAISPNFTLVGPTRGVLFLNYSDTGIPRFFTIEPKSLYAPLYVSFSYPTQSVEGMTIEVSLQVNGARQVDSVDDLLTSTEHSYHFDGTLLTVKIVPIPEQPAILPGADPFPLLQTAFANNITIYADCKAANIKEYCFGFMSRVGPGPLFNCTGEPVEMWNLTEEADLLPNYEYFPNTNCLVSMETELECSVNNPRSNCSGEMALDECVELCENTLDCKALFYNPYEQACRLTAGCSDFIHSPMTPWYSFVKVNTLFCPSPSSVMQRSSELNISAPDILSSDAVVTPTGWKTGTPDNPFTDPASSFPVVVSPSGTVINGASWSVTFKDSVPKRLLLEARLHANPILVSIPYPTSTTEGFIFVDHLVTVTYRDGFSFQAMKYNNLEALYDCKQETCYFYDGNMFTIKISPYSPIRETSQEVVVEVLADCEGNVCEGILSRIPPIAMYNCSKQQLVTWDLALFQQANYTAYDYHENTNCLPSTDSFDFSCSVYLNSSRCQSELTVSECKQLCDVSKVCSAFLYNPFESACRLVSNCKDRSQSPLSPWYMFEKNRDTSPSSDFPIAEAAGITIAGLACLFLIILIIACKRERYIKIVQDSTPMLEHELEELEWVRGTYWKAVRVIGSGAFGIVYEARNDSGKPLAVKVVACHSDEEVKNFEAEFILVKNLNHPNIVTYFNCEMIAGRRACLLMEYLAEGSLTKLITSMGSVPLQATKLYARDIMKGLEYLHANGIIHRDVKGDNVLLTSGSCKLTDFGCSTKATETLGASTVVGTPRWMAPEVIKSGVSGYGPKADVWSAGCTICQMLTGEPPWPKLSTAWEMMYHITNSAPDLPVFEDENTNRILKKMVCPCEERLTVSELLADVWFGVDETEIVCAS